MIYQKSKIKNQNYILKIKNFTFYIVILLFTLYILILTFPLTVIASESTPSADIQTKLELLKQEIASKAAAFKLQVDKKLKDKAYVGKIKTKSESTLTLATKNGPKLININQDSQFESQITHPSSGGKTKKSPSLKNLVEEDYLVALGDVDETGVLTAKKVILLPLPKAGQSLAEKSYLWGQIISISDKLITLKDKDSKNVAVVLKTSGNVKLNDFVILTGNRNKNDIFEAGFVHIIPQGGILKPKKGATSSATIKLATSSAKPKSATSSSLKR